MKNILNTILLIIALAVIAFFSMQKIDRFLDLKAINDCASEYRLEYTNLADNTKIIRPLDEPFKECITQKGVTNWYGPRN